MACGGAFAGRAAGGTAVGWLWTIAPPPQDLRMQVATWMLLPPGTAAGTWTALALALGGTAAYAFAGPRR